MADVSPGALLAWLVRLHDKRAGLVRAGLDDVGDAVEAVIVAVEKLARLNGVPADHLAGLRKDAGNG